jgi:hypothetical protein
MLLCNLVLIQIVYHTILSLDYIYLLGTPHFAKLYKMSSPMLLSVIHVDFNAF